MSEFLPVFKNTIVSVNDAGRAMQDVIMNLGCNLTNRRCLISSYFGESILLTTPVLKWMIEHGLVVTNVFCAMEYVPRKAFLGLVKEVTTHRTQADKDPKLKAYSETFKLLGNSYCGKCLTNVSKFCNVKYCNTAETA